MATRVSVKELRNRLGKNREDFGALFPVSARTVRRWENGEVDGMSPLAERRYAELCDETESETRRKPVQASP
jgi:DNA-binding XRE family transcriptional regulator